MTLEATAFSLISALLARVHLAGRIDTLTAAQRDAVRTGLAVYRTIRGAVARSVPVWPLGLSGWRDPVIACGARDGQDLYLAVWRRDNDGRNDTGSPATVRVPLPDLSAVAGAEVLYPHWAAETAPVAADGTAIEVTLPEPTSARLLRVQVADRERNER